MSAPVVDGIASVSWSGGTSKTLAITTSLTHDVILVAIGYELSAAARDVTSVTASGLTFTRRKKQLNAGQQNETVELWWAPAVGALTALNVTATWDAAIDDGAMIICGVNGCNDYTAPWDTNASCPTGSSSGSPPSPAISTDSSTDLLIGVYGEVNNVGLYNPTSGWTNVAAPHTNGGALAQTTVLDVKAVTATQSSAAYVPGQTGAGAAIQDALVGVPVVPDIRMTQGVRLALAVGDSDIRMTQSVRLTLGRIAPPIRMAQAVRLALFKGRYPIHMTQAVRLTLCRAVPCVTRWQQLWTINRRDGVVFRFTSLDADFDYFGGAYKSCGSLMPSAAEESSEVGSVSSMELTGILTDDGITEGDLYGGLFDDAFVTIWLVPFDGPETPRRLAAGWIGNVQHGERGWTGEVTGPGARLDQQALVTPYAAACRWTFGDSRCTKDLTALQTTGTVIEAANRGAFVSDAPEPGHGSQWEMGRVIWQTGRNAGITCEIKTADFAGSGDTGIVLWSLAPYLPEPGDTFIMQPGCDLSAPTCKNVYANLINFGGFKDVPGNDSIAETPIAKVDS